VGIHVKGDVKRNARVVVVNNGVMVWMNERGKGVGYKRKNGKGYFINSGGVEEGVCRKKEDTYRGPLDVSPKNR